jgi:hypothetical protein
LIQERIGNTLELVGIGKNFLNETPAAQQLRDSKTFLPLTQIVLFQRYKYVSISSEICIFHKVNVSTT